MNATVTVLKPKDPTGAARSKRYRRNRRTLQRHAAVTPSVTVDTSEMVALAVRLEAGTVTQDDLHVASRLVLALLHSLPSDSALALGINPSLLLPRAAETAAAGRPITQGETPAMKFRDDVVDLGAPTFAAIGPWKIERISVGQARVSYYTASDEGPVAAVHIICDYVALAAALGFADTVRASLVKVPPEKAGPPLHAH